MKANTLTIIVVILNTIISSTGGQSTKTLTTTRNEFVYDCLHEQRSKSIHSVYNMELKVELVTSGHVLDQLVTRIFAIILRDIFDYHTVTINTYENTNHNIQTCETEKCKVLQIFDLLEKPENKTKDQITIHLGMWMSTLAHNLIPQSVVELGTVMTPGRFGWFVPKLGIFHANRYYANDIKLDTDIFIDLHNKFYNLFTFNDDALKILENDHEIENKFISPKCEGRKCVTLLAEHRCDTVFIEEQINDSESYLNVYWLGAHFRQKLAALFSFYEENNLFEKSTFIVFHWTPSDVTDSRIAFTQFHMPICEDMKSLQKSYCKYELTPIVKYATKPSQWYEENKVIKSLRAFTIKDASLKSLLELNHNENLKQYNVTPVNHYNNVACKWLSTHRNMTNELWTNNKWNITLTIGGMFPFSSNTHRGHNYLSHVARKAVEAINRNRTILDGYHLQLYENDCKCKSDLVMTIFLNYYAIQNFLGVLGPACSETIEPIASISKHTKMAIMSYSADGLDFSNRVEYPYVFRTVGSNYQFIDAYLSIMATFGWTRIAAFTEEGMKSSEYISYMKTEMDKLNYKLIDNIKLIAGISASQVSKYLTDLKTKNTKIIIVDIFAHNLVYLVLCEAYNLQMTAYNGYVWFLPHWVSKNISLGTKCTKEELEHTIEGHFSLTYTAFGNSSSLMQEGISVKEWLSDFYGNNTDISQYTGFIYDAVWTYALAADKFLKAGSRTQDILGSKAMVDHLTEFIWKSDFQGLSGRVRFGRGGSRITTISIMQWINHTFLEAGIFDPKIINDTELVASGGNIRINKNVITWFWGDNRQPNDGSYDCYFGQILKVNCETADIWFSPTICLIFTLLTFSLSYFFWKRKYQRKFQSSVKIMKNFGIDFTALQYEKLTSLSKWEIAKDKIVPNRRLGEGAFCNVYGGEAFFDGKGWVVVAIKSLKVGASIEDRLDFLSEADAMKCLDHENIIKMLGVCLQSEPIYTIMEYMLYGDLRTYLLSRRNMTNEMDFNENSDVSPKQLTTYALHIIKGLEYLANQKYIHRDIACRNCLVNAQRIVKLADFGMSKSIVDSEYYRFSHKRMLPVRWMSPESLRSGVFTSASDIWSYGVVLYEIITFGEVPYRELTNKKVFQYVSNGDSLKLPLGIRQQLSSLIQACLSQEADKRPTASDIINYISNYPQLLTPCLDFAVRSTEITDTDSDKMEMVPDTASMIITTCYSGSYMAQSIPMKPYDQNDILSGYADMSSCNTNDDDEDDKRKPLPPCSFSITDGYSIMCPLLKPQVKRISNSPQLNRVTQEVR